MIRVTTTAKAETETSLERPYSLPHEQDEIYFFTRNIPIVFLLRCESRTQLKNLKNAMGPLISLITVNSSKLHTRLTEQTHLSCERYEVVLTASRLLHTVKKRELQWFGHAFRKNLSPSVLQGSIDCGRDPRPPKKTLDARHN